jgi:hypothetical protein
MSMDRIGFHHLNYRKKRSKSRKEDGGKQEQAAAQTRFRSLRHLAEELSCRGVGREKAAESLKNATALWVPWEDGQGR